MKIIVPDASVLLKWVLPGQEEQDTAPALHLRHLAVNGKVILKVPPLWLYEVGNTLTRRFAEQAAALLQSLIEFDFAEAAHTTQWLEQAFVLTRKYHVTFYDAAYHALALVEKGTFITADAKYVHKAKKAGSVVALQDWL